MIFWSEAFHYDSRTEALNDVILIFSKIIFNLMSGLLRLIKKIIFFWKVNLTFPLSLFE